MDYLIGLALDLDPLWSWLASVSPYLLAVLLALTVCVCWMLTLFGLPGNWLMLLAALGYLWLGPEVGVMNISWATIGTIAGLCVIGEIAENVAGMWGARRAGGSRKAAIYALLGSLVGAIVGGMLGLPIPLIGTPIGAILGGAVGALLGAALAEQTLGETGSQSLKVGRAAFWGRLLGVGIKSILATIIVALIVVSLFV